MDSRVELRQAEETGRDHLGKGTFHKVRSFPKNSVAPDENMSFPCIRANTTVSRANGRGPPSLEIQIKPPKSCVHAGGFVPPPCLSRTHRQRSTTAFLLSLCPSPACGRCPASEPHSGRELRTPGAHRDGPRAPAAPLPAEHRGGSGRFPPPRCSALHTDGRSKPRTRPTCGHIPKSLRNEYLGHRRFTASQRCLVFNWAQALGPTPHGSPLCLVSLGTASLGKAGLSLWPRGRDREEETPEVGYHYGGWKDSVLLLFDCI